MAERYTPAIIINKMNTTQIDFFPLTYSLCFYFSWNVIKSNSIGKNLFLRNGKKNAARNASGYKLMLLHGMHGFALLPHQSPSPRVVKRQSLWWSRGIRSAVALLNACHSLIATNKPCRTSSDYVTIEYYSCAFIGSARLERFPFAGFAVCSRRSTLSHIYTLS